MNLNWRNFNVFLVLFYTRISATEIHDNIICLPSINNDKVAKVDKGNMPDWAIKCELWAFIKDYIQMYIYNTGI